VKRWSQERGAVAVEFALILPILLLLLLGTIEFGRAYNTQLTLTQAARESVRTLAISNNSGNAIGHAKTASPTLNPALTDAQVAISFEDAAAPHTIRTSCDTGRNAIVTITYPLQTLTGITGTTGAINLRGKGVMRCAG
jgi:Flp pilus assembly protein TadG